MSLPGALAAAGGKRKIKTVSESKCGTMLLVDQTKLSNILDGSSGAPKVFLRSAIIAGETWKCKHC